MDSTHLITPALCAAIRAGDEIMRVYRTDFTVEHKSDDSPLTLADKRAHETIMKALSPLAIPILSEEGRHIPYDTRSAWTRFWLVDPLDGTKEFIKKNDEFTVNIAWIEKGVPTMGIIVVPAQGVAYFGETHVGAFRLEDTGMIEALRSTADPAAVPLARILDASLPLPLVPPDPSVYTIVGSRSHATAELEAFVNEKRRLHDNVEFISAGSSLKFCQVAEGRASIYPRMGPTMEWDTAAGQAIATCAGARVVRHDTGAPLVYNKENLLNPWFIVER